MLEVQIENIIPVTEARDKFNQIVDAVEGTEELYVLTKNGKPAAIVVGIHHLEKLTGESHTAVFGSDKDAAAPAPQTATPITDSVPAPAFNSAPTPVAPEPTTDSPQPVAQSDAVNYDGIPPVSTPPAGAAGISASTPIDNPIVDSSVPATGGQALAPDAVTPTQTEPSTDPFAIPSEPLDLPEDNQVQGTTPAPTNDNNPPTQAPPAPQV